MRRPNRFGDAHDVILGETETFHIIVVLFDDVRDMTRAGTLLAHALDFLEDPPRKALVDGDPYLAERAGMLA